MQFILYLKVNNFHNQETVCVFSAGRMCPQMLLAHFVVFRQNVEAVVWVRLRHSCLDSSGEHGWPESSRTSVLLFKTRLYCSGCTRRASPLNCPLGSLHPSGMDRTNRWIRVERSSTSSILMLECAEIHVCMKSFTWPVVDPHTFFYQSQKLAQQIQDHLKRQIVDQ